MPPGGAVQVGESLPEAVRREVREETGQLVDVHQLLSIHEFIQPPFHALEYYFKATISNQPQAEALKMDSKDHRVQEIRWVSQKDFTNYPIEPSYLHTLITKLLAAKLPEDPYPLFHQTRISDLPE
jgi:8-oxo-dGTP diphosphatase